MEEQKQPLGSTWYRLNRYASEIQERTVVKSTSQTVWYKDIDWHGKELPTVRQERKGSDWYPAKVEALAEMRKRLERSVEYTNSQYSLAVKKLKDFNLKYAGELG